jgi:hypothetical protein
MTVGSLSIFLLRVACARACVVLEVCRSNALGDVGATALANTLPLLARLRNLDLWCTMEGWG